MPINIRLHAGRASVLAAEDGREQEGDDLPNDSAAASLACAGFYCLGGAKDYSAVC